MKKLVRAFILALICGAFFMAAPAHAQKTKAELATEVTTTFPDNTAGLITPSGVRAFQNDLINSIMPTAPVVSGNLACFDGTTGLLQDCGSAPTTVPITVNTTPINGGTNTNVLYNNAGKIGEYTVSGTGNVAMTISPVFITPNLGAPSAAVLTNATGLPVSTGLTGAGTGVLTALGVNVGAAGAFVVNGGALGTPASGTLTNATGLPLSTGVTGTLQAAQFPALTGAVTTSAGSLSTSIANSAVTNAKMASMVAYTFKGNNSGSSAAPGDVDIALLTTKASPAAGDYVMISDQEASGAWKKVAVSALSSAGSVASYNGRTGTVTATGTDVPLRSYLAGLTLATAGSSTTFGIAAGVATDSTNVSMMALASAYTKTTSAWALGTAAGSLDTGTIAANTWYHVHLIQRPDTGVVDVLISLSATAPTLPTNYTLFRRIGSMATNGSSQWARFVQVGDEFLWTTPVNDVATTTLGTTPTLYTLSVPTSVQVNALFRGFISSATAFAGVVINSPDETSAAINTPAGNLTAQVQAASTNALFTLNLRTNTSAQIRAVASAASTSVTIATYGWVDRRGRDL